MYALCILYIYMLAAHLRSWESENKMRFSLLSDRAAHSNKRRRCAFGSSGVCLMLSESNGSVYSRVQCVAVSSLVALACTQRTHSQEGVDGIMIA